MVPTPMQASVTAAYELVKNDRRYSGEYWAAVRMAMVAVRDCEKTL